METEGKGIGIMDLLTKYCFDGKIPIGSHPGHHFPSIPQLEVNFLFLKQTTTLKKKIIEAAPKLNHVVLVLVTFFITDVTHTY